MLGSQVLEAAVGLIFIFLVVSVMATVVREGIEALVKSRGAYLERGIRELLQDRTGTGLAHHLYTHPLIYSLYSGDYKPGSDARKTDGSARIPIFQRGRNLPSYIPSRNFALALMDIAARGPVTDVVSLDPAAPSIAIDTLRRNLRNLENAAVQRALLTAIDSAQNDVDKVRQQLEAWYNSAMDRVSGWYKRSSHWIVFWTGLTLAGLLNVNTITIADYLYRNDSARTALVSHAQMAVNDTGFVHRSYNEAKATLDSASLPIGWGVGWGAPRQRPDPMAAGFWNQYANPVLGLFLTALAATLGAPFWFDVLSKIMVVRSTMKPTKKPDEEPTEAPPVERPPVVAPQVAGLSVSASVNGQRVLPAAPRDSTSSVDSCDVPRSGAGVPVTADGDLPPATGGILP